MKNKAFITLGIILLVSVKSFSQEIVCVDSLDSKNHEISFDVAALLSFTNVELNGSSFYLSFKSARKNYKIRAAVSGYGSFSSNNPSRFDHIEITDSSFVITEKINASHSAYFKGGIERCTNAKSAIFYYGADLMLGISQYSSSSTPFVFKQNNDSIFDFSFRDEPKSVRALTFDAGIAPFVGIDIPINDAFSFGLILPFNCYYRHCFLSDSPQKPDDTIEFTQNFHFLLSAKF